jgi:5'-nucleotidase/UDP-sugar diphosphatase
VKKVLVLAVMAGLAGVAGCSKKTTPAAGPALTDVSPPAPVHNGITPAAPIQTIAYSDPVVAPMDDITPSAPARSGSGAGKTYVVRKGDTLWGIAQRSYGDGKQYRKIVAANPTIKGDQLMVGQKIVIPS